MRLTISTETAHRPFFSMHIWFDDYAILAYFASNIGPFLKTWDRALMASYVA